MTVTPGLRLRSRVCDTEVIVVRAPSSEIVLHCGGTPMATFDEEIATADLADGWDTGALLGKRYTATDDEDLEVLVTKEGKGTLGDGTNPLVLKEAKPLPSSD
ncbi:MAG: hypothetical protein ACJ72O_01605 [Marmoricola sp.]